MAILYAPPPSLDPEYRSMALDHLLMWASILFSTSWLLARCSCTGQRSILRHCSQGSITSLDSLSTMTGIERVWPQVQGFCFTSPE
jgi:hypothetical protein